MCPISCNYYCQYPTRLDWFASLAPSNNGTLMKTANLKQCTFSISGYLTCIRNGETTVTQQDNKFCVISKLANSLFLLQSRCT